MARRLNISVAVWQLLASVPVLFCLVSKEWIVSSGQGETRGLFDICHSGNVSCNWTSDCAPCNPDGSHRTCTDFGDDAQGLDREIVGGILATILLARGITLVMSVVAAITGQSNSKSAKVKQLPSRVVLIEEISVSADYNTIFTASKILHFRLDTIHMVLVMAVEIVSPYDNNNDSGVADCIAIGIYLAYNNILLIENPCRTYGVAFWLNFARPASGILYLRLLHPALMSLTKSILDKRINNNTDDTKPLQEDEPDTLTHHNKKTRDQVC